MGFVDSAFGGGGDAEFQTAPQSKEAKFAREELMKIYKDGAPDVPLREIQDLAPMSAERTQARDKAMEFSQGQDIFSLPEVQGIIHEANQTGNLLSNRLGRAMQKSGNFTSTPGRDVLGRAVTDVQKSLSASLAPFASQERSRQAAMIPILEQLGLTEEGRQWGNKQDKSDASYNKQMTESQQLQNFLVPLLQSFIQQQPSSQLAYTPPTPGLLSQVSQIGNFLGQTPKMLQS